MIEKKKNKFWEQQMSNFAIFPTFKPHLSLICPVEGKGKRRATYEKINWGNRTTTTNANEVQKYKPANTIQFKIEGKGKRRAITMQTEVDTKWYINLGTK